MHQKLMDHLSYALEKYSTGDFQAELLKAKKYYFEKVGRVFEEDSDYENVMNSFNEWYLINYLSENSLRSPLKDYAIKFKISEEISQAINEVSYSVFEYQKKNGKGEVFLFDFLANKQIRLSVKNLEFGLIKNDLFIGRSIKFQNDFFLLKGILILPKEIKAILVKECKKIRNSGNLGLEEETFLLKLEALRTKWKRYNHLNPLQVFKF